MGQFGSLHWTSSQAIGKSRWMRHPSQLMAFTVGPLGFYKCDHMPFRLVNAPATFQRLMETYLGDLQFNWCLIHLNGIMMFSKTPKDHVVQLRAIFQKLKEARLKLKSSKCEYF